MATDTLQALGLGIIGFAIIIGVGTVVLQKFGDSVAVCPSGHIYNETLELCQNISAPTNTTTVGGAAYSNMAYLETQLGSSGLSGWVPAIIAITIGMLFLGYFLTKRGRRV